MKNYKSLFYTGAVILLLALSSCENMIDVDLPNNQIVANQVFEDVQTSNAALAALYGSLRDNSILSGTSAGALLGTYTDDLDAYTLTDINGIYGLYNNQPSDTNTIVYSTWANAYQNIYTANAIIEGANLSQSLSIAEKQRISAEAIFVRAILMYFLQRIYGDVPFPTSTDYNINRSLSKKPSKEILADLEKDFLYVSGILTDNYRSAERIFPNKKTAQLMLAKIYMLEKKWNEAEAILKLVVRCPLYPFQNDINKVFIKTEGHIIWQLKTQSATEATKEATLYYFSNTAPSMYALANDLVNALDNTDLRKQLWMTKVVANNRSFYRPNKYKNIANNTTEYSIVFRVEEAYLLLAETLAQQNKIDESLIYLNPTRERAGLLPVGAMSKENLLNEILAENRREFFTEMGHRFLDLKRMNQLNNLLGSKPNWKSFHELWPLPQRELLINNNLYPQNNGY